jgi:ribonuclease VapC
MVIDTSAILAILANEPEAVLFADKIAASEVCCMSAASLFESAIIVESRHGAAGGQKLDELVLAAKIAIEPVTADQIAIARVAYRMFGKGRHPARLNYGDCFAYALAKSRGEALLFKGEDFSQTDLSAA